MYVYSPKLNRMVHLFSNLEYDHWILIEANPQIITFCEQPKKVEWLVVEKLLHSIFDMWIERKDGSQSFIEIKYQIDLDPQNPRSERSLRQTHLQRKWCEENNYDYLIQTEKEIRNNPILLDNYKEIIPYIQQNRISHNDLDQHLVMQKIGKDRITIKQLREDFSHFSPSRLKQTLYSLILSGVVEANVDKVALNLTTEVWKNGT
nr:TnsA endonuclease N-terminal domain-containing protein [Brevibacillus laterosporus]